MAGQVTAEPFLSGPAACKAPGSSGPRRLPGQLMADLAAAHSKSICTALRECVFSACYSTMRDDGNIALMRN